MKKKLSLSFLTGLLDLERASDRQLLDALRETISFQSDEHLDPRGISQCYLAHFISDLNRQKEKRIYATQIRRVENNLGKLFNHARKAIIRHLNTVNERKTGIDSEEIQSNLERCFIEEPANRIWWDQLEGLFQKSMRTVTHSYTDQFLITDNSGSIYYQKRATNSFDQIYSEGGLANTTRSLVKSTIEKYCESDASNYSVESHITQRAPDTFAIIVPWKMRSPINLEGSLLGAALDKFRLTACLYCINTPGYTQDKELEKIAKEVAEEVNSAVLFPAQRFMTSMIYNWIALHRNTSAFQHLYENIFR